MCAKAINPVRTRTKEQAFQVTSTGLIPRIDIGSVSSLRYGSLPDIRDSKFSQ